MAPHAGSAAAAAAAPPSGGRDFYLLHVAYEANPDLPQGLPRGAHELPLKVAFLVCKTREGDRVTLRCDEWRPWALLPGAGGVEDVVRRLGRAGCVGGRVVGLKRFVGFTHDAVAPYLELRFRTWPAFVDDASLKSRMLELGVRAPNKFLHETGLRCGGWLRAHPDARGVVRLGDLARLAGDDTPPPLTLMAYDLETTGLDPAVHVAQQCCCVFWDTSAGPPGEAKGRDPRSVVICAQPTESAEGTPVRVVAGERELLLELHNLIVRHDPDVLLGYNLAFDNDFLWKRSLMHAGMDSFSDLSRVPGTRGAFRTQILSSSAMGTNERTLWQIPGRIVADLFLFAKQNYGSEPSYKLGEVGAKYVGATKDDVPWGRILEAFGPGGTPSLRGEVAKYCLQDGWLCLLLDDRWAACTTVLEEAAVSCVNPSTVVDTGRQTKVINLLLSELRGEYAFNPPESDPAPAGGGAAAAGDDSDDVGYQGATVIDTVRGFYGGPDDQVCLLDFASLYPSLMRAHGICPSRLVRRDRPEEVAASMRPGVVVVDYDLGGGAGVVSLARPSDPAAPPPKLTVVLEKLLRERALIRAAQKREPDPARRAILDARQKAKKVAANSAYGLLGASRGYLALPALAAVTTLTGRRALEVARGVAEAEYGATVVAGDTDSIMFLLPPGLGEGGGGGGTAEGADRARARMRHVFEVAARIAADVTSRLPPPLELELEAVMHPVVFYKKKCYSGKLYSEPDEEEPPLKMRGVVAVRNDWSLLSKRLATAALRVGIRENDPVRAVAILREGLAALRDGRVPVRDLVIRKELHSMDPKTISPHVALCRRIRAANPLECPALGSKVEFVIVRGPGELSDRSRHPEDARPEDLDVDFYFEKQLVKPLTELLGPLIRGGPTKLRRLLGNDRAEQVTLPRLVAGEGPEAVERADAGGAARAAREAAAAASASAGSKRRDPPQRTLAGGLAGPRKPKRRPDAKPDAGGPRQAKLSSFFAPRPQPAAAAAATAAA